MIITLVAAMISRAPIDGLLLCHSVGYSSSLPPPRRLCDRRSLSTGLSVTLSVCLQDYWKC